MKKSIINLIKILGIGLYEIIIDIELNNMTFNSIEWVKEEDKIYLHLFKDEYDYSYDFDDLEENQKILIYYKLSMIAYN